MKKHLLKSGAASRRYKLAGLCLSVMTASIGTAVAAAYESDTTTFQAGKLVDKKLLKGPNHTVQNEVVSKDYMNHYRIDSPFGEFSVTGDWAVAKMVHEIDAIAELRKMSKTEVFAQSAAEAAQKPVMAAKQLAEQPVETIKGIPAGVGRLFARTMDVVEDVAEKTSSDGGDGGSSTDTAKEAGTNLAKSYLGVGSAHRKLAQELKVDPYSTNKVLQAELSSIAKYATAGSFGVKLVMPSIPGANILTNVQDVVWNLSARDLKLRNEKALMSMGADEGLVERFMDNPHFTPTDQTLVVAGLEVLEGAAGRVVALEKAAGTTTRQEALVFARLMDLYASYHKARSPIVKITDAGRALPLAHSKAGVTVLAVPMDYVSWTKRTGEAVTAFAKSADKQSGGEKLELWVQGRVSDTARKELGTLGWAVFDRAFERLEKGAKN